MTIKFVVGIASDEAITVPPELVAAVAEAPVPPPPVKLTVGADIYQLPPEVMVIDVTAPFVTIAVAVAPLPPPPVNTTFGALI